MGRRRDDPRDQRAKGYPGRRKRKVEKAIEAMEQAAARDAELFAVAGSGAELTALPVFLEDKRLAAAQTIWCEYAPRLDRLHLLATLDRYHFAAFCIYAAEYVLANRDVLDHGHTIMVRTVAGAKHKGRGGEMPRRNPAVDIRDFAFEAMLKLGEKFGFTPLDRNKLIRDHAMRADEETLFGRTRSLPAEPASAAATGAEPQRTANPDAEATELIGTLGRLDAPGPGKLN